MPDGVFCDAVPVYILYHHNSTGSSVLFRGPYEIQIARYGHWQEFRWIISDLSALQNCRGHASYLVSERIPEYAKLYPPTTPTYWIEESESGGGNTLNTHITVVAGG